MNPAITPCGNSMEEREKQFFLSPEIAGRLAAIDIGTNSMRLIIAEPLRGGNYRILDEEKESTRLGVSLSKTGRLDPLAIEKSLSALRRMKQIAEGFQVTQSRTIATCAVREASNGAEFCRRAREELGVDIEVITAEQEALLAFFSVQRAFELTDKHAAVADIGGGSTEIVLAYGNLVEAIYTTQLGAVRLSEMFGNGPGMAGDDFLKMVDYIDRHLRKQTKHPVFIPHILFGSGGTFTSLASMVMAGKHQGNQPARGYQVTRAEVRHLLERLRKLPLRERSAVPGLSPDRVDIIVAGLAIVDRVMDRLEVNLLQVHNRGVRDGLLLTMIDQSLGPPIGGNQSDRDSAIERLSVSAGGELEHGRHVARMAGLIFSQLAELFGLEPSDQVLLETAARLQDVGYLINYEQHHKHSYQLILNSRLAGFQPNELELIANVARYHRGANPKRKHNNFRRLGARDQKRVRQLAAILRVAGGLDRSHTQQVHGLTVTHHGGTTEIRVQARQYPDLDIWGARRRAELFEKVFDTHLTIDWEDSPADQPASKDNGHPQRAVRHDRSPKQ
jgi:exopolyphosphatase / guanosine-5'-triphosphate,3'-diphosphate pyrophosphatase